MWAPPWIFRLFWIPPKLPLWIKPHRKNTCQITLPKPPQTPFIIPITWNPEYSPGDCFINDWYFSKKCRANVSSENIIMVINQLPPEILPQKICGLFAMMVTPLNNNITVRCSLHCRCNLTQLVTSVKQCRNPSTEPPTDLTTYRKCISNFLSTWLANQQWLF